MPFSFVNISGRPQEINSIQIDDQTFSIEPLSPLTRLFYRVIHANGHSTNPISPITYYDSPETFFKLEYSGPEWMGRKEDDRYTNINSYGAESEEEATYQRRVYEEDFRTFMNSRRVSMWKERKREIEKNPRLYLTKAREESKRRIEASKRSYPY